MNKLNSKVACAGMEVHLSNCFKVEQMRKARGWVKTNKKDADLISLLPFELSVWWKVWRAPPDVRNRREQMRFRGDLVGEQTAVKSRIHAIFHRHGIFHEFSDLFGAKGRQFLAELSLDNPVDLPAEVLLALRWAVTLVSGATAHLSGPLSKRLTVRCVRAANGVTCSTG